VRDTIDTSIVIYIINIVLAIMTDLYKLTASQAQAGILAGKFTIEDYVKSLLARINDRQHLKAWAYLDADYVITEAKRFDALPPEKRGPLHGVVIGVKDVILTKGWCSLPSSCCPGLIWRRNRYADRL
jgi:Asp-tRNA(Asn)/Glu-tRNA(Gln) amidotransferase A subunit family amidase